MARRLILDREGYLHKLITDLTRDGYMAVVAHNDYEGDTAVLWGPLAPAPPELRYLVLF